MHRNSVAYAMWRLKMAVLPYRYEIMIGTMYAISRGMYFVFKYSRCLDTMFNPIMKNVSIKIAYVLILPKNVSNPDEVKNTDSNIINVNIIFLSDIEVLY